MIGLFSCWRLSLGYIYGQEIISEMKSNIAGSIFNLFDAFIAIFSSFFLLYFSQNWVNLHSVFVGLVTLSLFISFILPESPKFLVSRRHYDEAFEAYNYIARINSSETRLVKGVHRFKEQKTSDKKVLTRHFKRT